MTKVKRSARDFLGVLLSLMLVAGLLPVMPTAAMADEVDYSPVITTQPSAYETADYSDFAGVFLELEAEAPGGGELSYQWYRIGEDDDELLSDDIAMDNMLLAPANIVGVSKYYCVVTNTVNGAAYSTRSNVSTVTINAPHREYIAKVNVFKGDEQILNGQGSWQGKQFDIDVDAASSYKLQLLPINVSSESAYSMSLSYNGQAAVPVPFQRETILDTSQFPAGNEGYLVVTVGELAADGTTFAYSETYRINVSKETAPTYFKAKVSIEANNPVKVGDTITANVVATANNGIAALQGTLIYDSSLLELTGVTKGTGLSRDASFLPANGAPEALFSFYENEADATHGIVVATATFKVLKAGDASISISDSVASLRGDAWDYLVAADDPATVTVISDALLGDVNGNARVNIVDAQVVYDMATNKYGVDYASLPLPDAWNKATLLWSADVNGDGAIDATDAFAIQHFAHYSTWN